MNKIKFAIVANDDCLKNQVANLMKLIGKGVYKIEMTPYIRR